MVDKKDRLLVEIPIGLDPHQAAWAIEQTFIARYNKWVDVEVLELEEEPEWQSSS